MPKVGLVGLGAMGKPMALNFLAAGFDLTVTDLNAAAVEEIVKAGGKSAANAKEVAAVSEVVVTMVPNDAVLERVTTDPDTGLFASGGKFVHVSCSTISPDTSRKLAPLHAERGCEFVGAPVFARADGIAAKAASFCVGGEAGAVAKAKEVLQATSNGIFEFGADPGAGNVVKLCGNFMIASAIETCGEALTLAEKNGLDRKAVMDMLSSTIFDCLIYKGYGGRVAVRQHTPGQELVGPGFALDLGHKDINLTLDCARKSEAPMPIASLLQDRFLRSRALGRSKMDWSAVALSIAEDAGVDVSAALKA